MNNFQAVSLYSQKVVSHESLNGFKILLRFLFIIT